MPKRPAKRKAAPAPAAPSATDALLPTAPTSGASAPLTHDGDALAAAPAPARPQQTSAGGLASADILAPIIAQALEDVAPARYGAQKRAFKRVSWRWRDAVTMLSMETAVVSGIRAVRQLLAVGKASPERLARIRSLTLSLADRAYFDPVWVEPAHRLVGMCAPSLSHLRLELDPNESFWIGQDALRAAVGLRSFRTNQRGAFNHSGILNLLAVWPRIETIDGRGFGLRWDRTHGRLSVELGCSDASHWMADDAFVTQLVRWWAADTVVLGLSPMPSTGPGSPQQYSLGVGLINELCVGTVRRLIIHGVLSATSDMDDPVVVMLQPATLQDLGPAAADGELRTLTFRDIALGHLIYVIYSEEDEDEDVTAERPWGASDFHYAERDILAAGILVSWNEGAFSVLCATADDADHS